MTRHRLFHHPVEISDLSLPASAYPLAAGQRRHPRFALEVRGSNAAPGALDRIHHRLVGTLAIHASLRAAAEWSDFRRSRDPLQRALAKALSPVARFIVRHLDIHGEISPGKRAETQARRADFLGEGAEILLAGSYF